MTALQPIAVEAVLCRALTSAARQRGLRLSAMDVRCLASAGAEALAVPPQPTVTSRRMKVRLTQQQVAALIGAARGEGSQATGRRLGLARDTVKTHRQNAFRSLGAHSAAQAVAIAMAAGLIHPGQVPIPGGGDES